MEKDRSSESKINLFKARTMKTNAQLLSTSMLYACCNSNIAILPFQSYVYMPTCRLVANFIQAVAKLENKIRVEKSFPGNPLCVLSGWQDCFDRSTSQHTHTLHLPVCVCVCVQGGGTHPPAYTHTHTHTHTQTPTYTHDIHKHTPARPPSTVTLTTL